MIIIHGDNIVQSRDKLVNLLDNKKTNSQIQVKRIQAKKLELALLEESLQSQNFFDNPKLLVIEELHSLPKSQKKKNLIQALANSSENIILWEKRKLTKTMLKKFPKAQIYKYELTNYLFKWLDSINPQKNIKSQLDLFTKALEENGEWSCFSLLCWKIRMLIQAKENQLKTAPFLKKKAQQQSKLFTMNQLLRIHTLLLKWDLKLKQSNNIFSLEQSISWLIMNLKQI